MDKIKRVFQDIDIRTRNGTFFYVEFTKRSNGNLREMLCRRFVKWDGGKTGESRDWDAEDYDLLQVWDVEKEGYRMIPLENVHLVRAGGDEIRYDV